MSNKVYAGVSAFFANRAGNHNWLDNVKRPFLSIITTAQDGSKRYNDLFINQNEEDIKVSVRKDRVHISFPKDLAKPLFNVLEKSND